MNIREEFEAEFKSLPMEGVAWFEKTGCYYVTVDEELIPEADYCNDMFDSFKAGHKAATEAKDKVIREERKKISEYLYEMQCTVSQFATSAQCASYNQALREAAEKIIDEGF